MKLLTEKQQLRDLLNVKKELMKKQKVEEAEENEGEEEGALRLSEMDLVEDDEDEEEEQEKTIPKDQTEKRAITYEMAKNKGLTPKRKKELRNPRVKNRRKYEKAKIRRKGQVRTTPALLNVKKLAFFISKLNLVSGTNAESGNSGLWRRGVWYKNTVNEEHKVQVR